MGDTLQLLFYDLPWPCGFLASRRIFKAVRALLASFKAKTEKITILP